MRYTISVSLKRTPALYNALNKLSENQSLEKEFDIIVSNFIRDNVFIGSGFYEVSFPSEQDYLMFLLRWT
jgi:hypothetical protein